MDEFNKKKLLDTFTPPSYCPNCSMGDQLDIPLKSRFFKCKNSDTVITHLFCSCCPWERYSRKFNWKDLSNSPF